MSLVGSYQKVYNLYIPSGRRRRWAQFKEHVENEGKRVNEVIMDLVDSYMKFKPEDEE